MSAIERAIAAQRRRLDQREAPARAAMRAAYREAIGRLQVDLELVGNRIREARAAGEEVNPDWLHRQSRYRRLLDQSRQEFNRFREDGAHILNVTQRQAALDGAAAAVDQLGAVNIGVANVNVPAVERFVSSTQPGSPLRGVLDSYGGNAASVIERELSAGLIQGKGVAEITRNIRRGLTTDLTDARLDALVRNEMMRSFRGSQTEQYQRVGHLLEGKRWSAAHDDRTCLACIAQSGKVFPLDYEMPSHSCCRCSWSPAPIHSLVSAPQTGADWLAQQSPKTQRQMIGSNAAFDAYREGAVSLDDFVGRREDSVWGPSVFQMSWKQVERGFGG